MDKKESSFRVDAHQHFWIYNEEEYKWIGESMLKLRRNFRFLCVGASPTDLTRD